MHIRVYTLATHVGFAPCWAFDDAKTCEVLTLANCKPGIRRVAKCEDWIAAVTPKAMENRLAYVMQVRKMTRSQYWEQYGTSRLDCVYEPSACGWKQVPNKWHDERLKKVDLSSEWILWSTKFYVFAHAYHGRGKPQGISLSGPVSSLKCGGRRYGTLVQVRDEDFWPWIRGQQPLKLTEFDQSVELLNRRR